MTNGRFIGRLEVEDVHHRAGPSGLGKPPQQGLLLGHCHVLALPPAHWLRLKRRDPAVVKGHVRAVHGARRNPHRFRDGRLGHTALAQQHHLDALALRRRDFPAQGRFQLANLLLAALTIRSPRIG